MILIFGLANPSQGAQPTISALRTDSNIVVNFTGRLQGAGWIEGPFANVVGARSPYLAQFPESGAMFWRSVFDNVSTIAAGDDFMLAVRTDGTLWEWGTNYWGALGVGTNLTARLPVQVGTNRNWQAVSAGPRHAVAIQSDGTLWTWGYNINGELGHGRTGAGTNRPGLVSADTNWCSVSAGGFHTVALRTDGTLWVWGDNHWGQAGNGTTLGINQPTQSGSESNWVSVVAGYGHTMSLRADGSLWGCGGNGKGQLGIGTAIDTNQLTQVGTNVNWRSVAAGQYHTVGLRDDGTLWVWGDNQSGQLGLSISGTNQPTQLGADTNWVAVAAGADHTVALRNGGTLWGWGANNYGALGIGRAVTTTNRPIQLSDISNWRAVECAAQRTMALRADGTLWVWGKSFLGAGLGNGATTSSSQPLPIAGNLTWRAIMARGPRTMALSDDNTLWVCGLNLYGELGVDTDQEGTNQLVKVNGGVTWSSVSPGQFHTVGVRTDHTLWAWGRNADGQLGLGNNLSTNRPAQVGLDSDWQMVAAGGAHTAALRTDGTLWTWGENNSGQLGNGSFSDTNQPSQVGTGADWHSVAVGSDHTLGLRADATLWAWGFGSYGKLGIGGYGSTSVPTQVGTNANWVAVSAGLNHTVGLRSDGTLWTWGHNGFGQLGNGTDSFAADVPVRVGAGSSWMAVAAGEDHTVALRTDGTLWGWGRSWFGQLGSFAFLSTNQPIRIGTDVNWVAVAAGAYHTVALSTDGKLWGWGDNTYGELAQPWPWFPNPVPGSNWTAP